MGPPSRSPAADLTENEVHRTRFGCFLRPAGVPWSRRTSNTPAELRLLPTQRPVREGIYADSPVVRKDSGTTKTRSQRENAIATSTGSGRPARLTAAWRRKRNDRTPAVSSTLPAYRCLERRLYPCGASTYFGWRSVQGGSYGTGPSERKRPRSRKSARSEKNVEPVTEQHLRAILGSAWSGVRAAEGARLEIAWAGLTRLEGSNPSHSVSTGARRVAPQRPSASIPGRFPGV